MDDDGNRETKRDSYKLWYVVLAIAAVFVVVLGLCFVFHTDGVEKRLAALREAGQPTSFAELAEYTSQPDDAENAAGAYIDAFSAYVRPADDVNLPIITSKVKLPERGEPLPEPMAEAMSKYLLDNRKCLALLREAGRIEYCRYQWNYATGSSQYWKESRECAKLLAIAVVFSCDKGDTEAVAGHIIDGLRIIDSLAHDPLIFVYVVRLSCASLPVSGLEQALNAMQFSDRQLRRLDQALSQTNEKLDFSKALITEQCQLIEYFTNPSLATWAQGGAKLMKVPLIKKAGLLDYLDCMAFYIEASKMPGTKRLARSRELDAEMRNLSFMHHLVKTIMPSLRNVNKVDLRVKSQLDLARTALAIERYRLAKGSLPQRLEQLIPQYLRQIPTDPFNDKPIRYKQTNPRYILYSVGEDGKNKGGKEKDDQKQNEPHDLTFIVTR